MVLDRNFEELISAGVPQILCLDVQREGNVEGAVHRVCNSFVFSHFAGFPPGLACAPLTTR